MLTHANPEQMTCCRCASAVSAESVSNILMSFKCIKLLQESINEYVKRSLKATNKLT